MTRLPPDEVFALHADFCKTIAHPTRLKIVTLLRDGERTVGELVDGTGASLVTVSQHLRAMRDRHVVLTRKEGRNVYYRLRDPELVRACELMRSILLRGLNERGELARRETKRRRKRS